MKGTRNRQRIGLLCAAATATLTFVAQPSSASLAINWLGDDYTGGNTWTSNSSGGALSISAQTTGTFVAPVATANAFGTHTGVDFSAGNSCFDVPNGTVPINENPANFTIACVFKANGQAATTGNSFFQGQMMFGDDSPGGGTPDWCFVWGSATRQSVFGSIGTSNAGDSALLTGSLDLSAVHAAVMSVDATGGTQSLFIDGKLAARRTGITIAPRNNPLFYRIGGGFFNGSFNGKIAELRVYDDAGQNGALLSSQLANTYGGTYGVQQLFTWTAAAGSWGTPGNWDIGTVPNDVGYHQALINNGGTIQLGSSDNFSVSDLWAGTTTSAVGHVVQTGGTLNVGVSMVIGQNGGSADYDMSGGTLNAPGFTVAGAGGTTSFGTMTLRGNATVNVINGGPISIGNVGTGRLNLQDTAQLNTGTSELWVGNGSTFSSATMVMSGGTLSVNNWLAVGRDRATGTLNFSGGLINKTGNGNITIGAVNTSTFSSIGTVNQTGGQIVSVRNPADAGAPGLIGGEIYLGETTQGKGTWNFSAGSASAPIVNVGYGGQGTLNLSGTAQITSDGIGVARAGTFGGVANLNGGTITTAQVFRGGSTGPAQVNFNGTAIVVPGDNDRFVSGFNSGDLVLQPGGALINTNGHNIGIDSGFSGAGPLIKNGAGVMTINAGANNTHSGPTVINAGTVKLQRVTANNSLLASNVAAYYQFNDATNVGKDSSPSANDLFDVFGTATISTATAPPNHTASLSLPNNLTNADFLSSADGNVPTNFPVGNSSYTLAAWIDVDNTNTNFRNGIVGWGGFNTNGRSRDTIALRTGANTSVTPNTPNNLQSYWWNDDLGGNISTSLTGAWHHVVATYDAVTDIRRIYVDGTLVLSDFQAGLNGAGTANFHVGAAKITNTTTPEFFSGNMADLLVTRSALTPAQIQQLINQGLTFGTFTGGSGSLSPNSLVQVASGAILDLNGASTPSGGLGNVGATGGLVTSSAAGSAVLGLNPVGTASFSGIIEDGAGTVGISKSGAGAQVLSGNNTYTGTTTVQGGALVLSSDGSQATVFTAGRGGADITGGRVVFDYNTAADRVAQIKTMLHDGFNEPTKFATGAIRSSTATAAIGLGYINNAGAKQMTVALAYYGDANLDGRVNALDFNAVATNFGQSSKEWVQGDFNYDGNVNTLDFNALAGNFNAALPAPAPALGALVPEPGALFLLPAVSALILRRRRGRG